MRAPSNDLVSRVLRHLQSQKYAVEIGRPATEPDFEQFTQRTGRNLPEALEVLYRAFNGSTEDDELIGFLSLDDIECGSGRICFAEFLAWSHFYALDDKSGAVFIPGYDHAPVAASLPEFLEAYLVADSPLLPPE